jgi:RHS repeat-associated protein
MTSRGSHSPVDSSGTVDFIPDDIGSTWGLANAGGDAQTNFWYAPFGFTTGGGTGTNSDIDFAGRELDMNNILYYMRNRYYSPVLSRFISPDPAGLAGGDLNLYPTPTTTRPIWSIRWA